MEFNSTSLEFMATRIEELPVLNLLTAFLNSIGLTSINLLLIILISALILGKHRGLPFAQFSLGLGGLLVVLSSKVMALASMTPAGLELVVTVLIIYGVVGYAGVFFGGLLAVLALAGTFI